MAGGTNIMALGLCAAVLTISLAAPHAAAGQGPTYPIKPVRVVVGLTPGGATDAQARVFAQRLSTTFGQPFIVDNRPGAGGLIGFQMVAKAAGDGYTLLATSPSLTTIQAFQERPTYDPVRDFAPISLLTRAPYVVVIQPEFQAGTIADLIAFARARPGSVNFGLSGLGSVYHLAAAWFVHAAGVTFTLIPYKGVGPALSDLLGGRINATFSNPTNIAGHLRSKRLRALAVTSSERSRVFPELPTVAESGLAGFDVTSWQGWLAPAGTPASVVNRLNVELAGFAKTPEIAEKQIADGGEAVGNTPAQFRKLLELEANRWRTLVNTTGIRMEP